MRDEIIAAIDQYVGEDTEGVLHGVGQAADEIRVALQSDEAVDRVADVLAIEITGLDYALLEYDRQDEQWDQRTMRKIARAAIAALIGEGE